VASRRNNVQGKETSATHVADVARSGWMPQCAQEQRDYNRKGAEGLERYIYD